MEFDIRSVKEKENKVVDTLIQKFHVGSISTYHTNLRNKIIEAIAEDEYFLQIKRELLANPIQGKYANYRIEEYGLILYKGQVYIPHHSDIKKQVLEELHEETYSVHPKYQNIVTATKKSYF